MRKLKPKLRELAERHDKCHSHHSRRTYVRQSGCVEDRGLFERTAHHIVVSLSIDKPCRVRIRPYGMPFEEIDFHMWHC